MKNEYNLAKLKSRFPNGVKYIAYNPERKTYLRYDCIDETPDRNYAWVGTRSQYDTMRSVYPYSEEFRRYRDGDERAI